MTQNAESNPENTILHARAVEKTLTYLDTNLTILKDVEFTVHPRETLAIIGASGSGKSTLLSIISGLDQATSGQISLLGKDLMQMDEDQRAALRLDNVGFIFQNFQLMPTLTAIENVMLPLEIANRHSEAKEKAASILERVGLGHRLDHYPKHLSGGEQQRVAIARAFVHQPKILFADEPTGNLDSASAVHVMDLLFELNQEHGTVLIIVTHDMKVAKRCARQLTMQDKKLVEEVLHAI